MRDRCPSSQFLCIAELRDHVLGFTRKSEKRGCGVADAIPAQGKNIWGVVYHINEIDRGRLDKAEGYAPGRKRNSYIRKERHVFANGDDDRPLLVSMYFAEQQSNPPLTNAEYKWLIVEGAKFWHLPEDYLVKLDQIRTQG